ncbi:MAG: hypothetical protein F6K08_23515 [Okeania sp. SIO1H6]|uniref:Tc1-like transposase DDE domain-containing protein n=2 Tax=Okeania hirsuta TaxID=1458930 RepID=A0A3N6P8T8_9CYAN|nr:transposase [Okeania hirsuta]NET15591.1 hypothetical protein [Okeania sp. SIO1H6]RQH40786.1 hypothetical protein D5R40_16275 [Okeania hirsuta]
MFLPAYSPDLSPIELCWSKFKEFLGSRQARTQEQLNRVISEALAEQVRQLSRGDKVAESYI